MDSLLENYNIVMKDKRDACLPLLTIAIPTYNRAAFLEKGLSLLREQSSSIGDSIEILVSDNNSPDSTSEVVEKAINAGLPVRYIRNDTNIGADRNVVQCFEKAQGHFVWIIGDDDYIVPGVLPLIYESLSNNQDLSVCYIANKWIEDVLHHNPATVTEIDQTRVNDPIEFINKVNYWVTFLSGNIINKSFVSNSNIDVNKYIGTSLPQLSWYFTALFSNSKYLVINTVSVICQSNNTSGYNLVEVFGKNFNRIMDDFNGNKYYPQFKRVINRHLINNFFFGFVNDATFSRNKWHFLGGLCKLYWNSPTFWRKFLLSRVIA